MGLVIMAYAGDALKEYSLPAMNDMDYTITLEKTLYRTQKDINLKLENINGQWKIVNTSQYIVYNYSNEKYDGGILQDGQAFLLKTDMSERLSLLVAQTDGTFKIMHKYPIDNYSQIRIGSDKNCEIKYVFQSYISKNHAIMQRSGNDWFISDYSSNGTFMDGIKIGVNRQLNLGDCISIYGLKIVFLGNIIAVGESTYIQSQLSCSIPEYRQTSELNNKKIRDRQKVYYKRSPRQMEKLYDTPVSIDTPPNEKHVKKKPMFLTIGPSFTMVIPMLLGTLFAMLGTQNRSGAYMFTGIITAMGSAVFGVFWALNNLKYTRIEEEEEEKHRYNAYGQYLIQIANFLKEKYEYNVNVLNDMYLPADYCCTYDENNNNLWNRNLSHDDFLAVRLGIGNMPFQVPIEVPEQKFMLISDELMQKPAELKQSYETLYSVPICIDLKKYGMVGIVGGAGMEGARQVVLDMVAQLAVNNCYTDVKLVFLYDETMQPQFWQFARWLPHVWSEDKKCRFVAANKQDLSDVSFELSKVLRDREESENASGSDEPVMPHYIIFVENIELLEGELLLKYLMNPKPEYGITTVLMAENYNNLPNMCEEIIDNSAGYSGMYNVTESRDKMCMIQFDEVSVKQVEGLARRLSGIEVNESVNGGEIPNSLDFFEMYGISSIEELNVIERWTKNRTYDSMKALIGKKGGNSDCYLDIHEKYHGPHGLVAGTTGSGKSETLQTYMLSLAVNFSPYDIGFFIIDFKGGGMANLFSNLPHMVGQISNLSGNQVRRAMISIKSENKRRQRIFSEHSVNNINLYTRLYKNHEAKEPIPHLFIIIDEFAELKREEPEFMKELISVAQVGRSLGVHLILATQKPSGTVDDNIWSNTKFRLCLRVQDRQDSNDMLHKPDAAYITQAGRGYLQVGNDEIYELFQSGYSGAVYDPDMTASKTAVATMITLTGKAAIVGNRTKKKKKDEQKYNWYKLLIEVIMDNQSEMQMSIEDICNDEQNLKLLCNNVISNLQFIGEDYEASQGNIAKLKTFIDVMKDMPQDIKVSQDKSRMAEYILQNTASKRLPERKEKTQLDAVVEYLSQLAQKNGYHQDIALWLPVLPQFLYLNELSDYKDNAFDGNIWRVKEDKWTLQVPVGLYDDPENQAQNPLIIDMAESGHLAVCGTVASGKSTFLQTFVYSLMSMYSPAHIQFYMLDFSSHMLTSFENAPHTGGVVYDSEEDKLKKFINLLERMMNERKELFKGGNYSQYVRAYGIKLPAIVIVIDNYANFNEKTAGAYESTILRLAKEGISYGIFMAVSSGGFGMNELPTKIADNIKNVITLDMGDKFKYADVLRNTRISVLPESGVRGRGLVNIGGNILEYQTALALKATDDYERLEKLKKEVDIWDQKWDGIRARKIPQIPEKPVLSEFVKLDDYKQMQHEMKLAVGYRMEDASVYGVDLRRTYCYLISGKNHTGKTNMLKVLIHAAALKEGSRVVVIENNSTELENYVSNNNAQYISDEKDIFEFFKETVDIFRQRNQKKQQCIKDGMEDDEIFNVMQTETPYFIFIADIIAFIDEVYHPKNPNLHMEGYLENITEKGFLHNFYFFGCINFDNASKLFGLKMYSNMMSYKTGIHFGGYVNSQKLFQFTNIPFSQANKPMKTGLGLIPGEDDISQSQQVVIPLAK